jgi:UDP-N-acetylglucosamine 1-carboxyvinyltransferase
MIAALAADGQTEISHVEHLDRGYESLESKLTLLGARVVREGAAEAREVG